MLKRDPGRSRRDRGHRPWDIYVFKEEYPSEAQFMTNLAATRGQSVTECVVEMIRLYRRCLKRMMDEQDRKGETAKLQRQMSKEVRQAEKELST